MMQMKWTLLLLLASLTGCATLNESECRSVDWTELGRSDGVKGFESTRLGEHIEACGKFSLAPDVYAYRAGREEGLRQYCTPENALKLGASGSSYQQVCSGEAGELFALVHARGVALHVIKNDIKDLLDRLEAERSVMSDVQDLALYKKLDQNVRYFEREKQFMQSQYDQAALAVDSGYDPPFFEVGEWRSGIPYPRAMRDAEARRSEDSKPKK